jgi:hypothetical protein
MRVAAAALCAAAASALHASNASAAAGCVAPGTCTPPKTLYSRVIAGPQPGQQWNIAGGFCGAFSVQHAALAQGAWISQDLVRKANRDQTGIAHNMHGDRTVGFEVMPINVAYTASKLRLNFDEWDSAQPAPQAPAFKRWLKKHLAAGHAIAWFPICKGDSHECYPGSCPNGGSCDHVEPMYGIFSNHPLTDPNVYDDDVILHASDQDLEPYYRPLNSLDDTVAMTGNCAKAGSGFGKNEMYPCFDSSVTYGLAVLGLNVSGALLPVSLSTPGAVSEPDVRVGAAPVPLKGTVTVAGLRTGDKGVLYRFNATNPANVPTGPPFAAAAEYSTPFTATGAEWTFVDPVPFISSGATYYIAERA